MKTIDKTDFELELEGIVGSFGMPNCARWTPEQWDAHDRAVAESKAVDAARASAVDVHRRRDVLGDPMGAGWPARALASALSADIRKPCVARVRSWDPTEPDQNILVLSGSAGCGKTTAAAWWALQQVRPTKFLRATSFASRSKYDDDARAEWITASSLVLDDLGAEFSDGKGSFLSALDELIDTFYGSRRALIITTNSTLQDFERRYQDRVFTRLKECAVWFGDASESLRGR